MQKFSQAAESIASTTRKLEKTGIVADYLKSRSVADAACSALFFSGRAFAMYEEATLQVGGALLWRTVAELSGKSDEELTAGYRRLGDLGAVAGEVLPADSKPGVSILEVRDAFRQIASARGPSAKAPLLRDLLSRANPQEAKYLIKIMTGDLRIGLKESLVEEAIAKAFGATLPEVQRTNMLLGDIGETVVLAAAGRLAKAHMRLFHPLGFMLASPLASAEEAFQYFTGAIVEDKYDGIRAQAHCSQGEVRLFSRTRDDITESFPELPKALAGLPQDAVLDGEIVAWSYLPTDTAPQGHALPFTALQQRLGRRKVSHDLMRQVPVAYLAFDLLHAGIDLLIDRPLRERSKILEKLLSAPRVEHPVHSREKQTVLFSESEPAIQAQLILAPVHQASTPGELDQLFDAAQERGNEGLMLKDPDSAYTPGRRGKSWLKLKRELATLDVVVTAVEYGHGRRIGVLSDYTFAVWDDDRLVNIGKAYSGLTDAEISEMTQWFLEHTTDDQGFRREVEPKIVLEVAFNNMMRSERHNSGYALRFPRIVRIRTDKSPEDADTIERVKEIYQMQQRGN
jgi:DNA ligase 1